MVPHETAGFLRMSDERFDTVRRRGAELPVDECVRYALNESRTPPENPPTRGVMIGLVVGAVIIRRLQAAILDSIERADGVRAAESLLSETMSSLGTVALVVGGAALIAAIIAYLAGRPAWLDRLAGRVTRLISRADGPSELDRRVGAHYETFRIAGVVLAVAILFVAGVGVIQLVVLGLLLALYLWALSESNRRAAPEQATPGS